MIGSLIKSEFHWILYRAESLPPAEIAEMSIEVVGPGERLSKAQFQFLRREWSRCMICYLLRLRCWGKGWVFLAKQAGQFVHYTFACSGRHYRRELPPIKERHALLVGPCGTHPQFRGRSIYSRVLRYAVNWLSEKGHGPFYINVSPYNVASIRGIEKAGFIRLGVWAGKKRAANLWTSSVRVGD